MADDLIIRIGADSKDLQNEIDRARKKLAQFETSSEGVGKAVKGNATPALQEFSRVIQDAPYGIQGVANNIQQLTAQFGNLLKSTGGTKAALKAMVGSLVGPAGVLLAVSVVTSLLVTYGDKLTGNKKATDDSKKAQDELTAALRKQKDLRKELNTELDVATQAAVLEAKLAGKSAKDILAIQNTFSDARVNILKGEISQRESLIAGYVAKERAEWKANEGKVTELSKTYAEARKTLVRENLKAESEIRKIEGQKAIALLRFQLEQQKNLLAESATAMQAETKTQIQAITQGAYQIAEVSADAMNAARTRMLEGLKGIVNDTNEYSKEFTQALNNGIVLGIVNLATSIGDAFASGQNAAQTGGQALLATIGGVLQTFGGLVVAAGVAALGLEQAIKNWFAGGGIVAIAAGTALIAAGAAVKSFASNLGSGSGNASYGSSSVAGSGSSNLSGSTVSQSNGSSEGGRYVFEIEGSKLVGVLSNTLARNRAIGTDIGFGY